MAWQPPAVGTRATWTRTITAEDVEAFARFSGDWNPLHFDPGFALSTRAGGLIVHGGLTTALFNALVAQELPGPGSVFLHQEWDYPAPVIALHGRAPDGELASQAKPRLPAAATIAPATKSRGPAIASAAPLTARPRAATANPI
jgi:hypothetical protein